MNSESVFQFKRFREQVIKLAEETFTDPLDIPSAFIVLAIEMVYKEGAKTWPEYEETTRCVFENYVRNCQKKQGN